MWGFGVDPWRSMNDAGTECHSSPLSLQEGEKLQDFLEPEVSNFSQTAS